MHRITSGLTAGLLVFSLSLLLFSCGAVNYLKSTVQSEPSADDGPPVSHTQELEDKVIRLKQQLADQTFILDKKDAQIKQLKIRNASLEKRLARLEKKNEAQVPKQKRRPVLLEPKDASPQNLYKKARNLLLEDNFSQAADLFIQFIKKYPEHSLADNAVYWLGECYYSLRQFKKAIPIFKDLEHKYPKSEKVPDANLKLGYSYLSLNDTNRAHHYLKKVIKTYPFSPAAEKAEEKLKEFE